MKSPDANELRSGQFQAKFAWNHTDGSAAETHICRLFHKFTLQFLVVVLVGVFPSHFVFAQSTVQDAKAKAIQLYPDLGVKGSLLNLKFISTYQTLQRSNPDFFKDPFWPLTLAKECSDTLNNGTPQAPAQPAAEKDEPKSQDTDSGNHAADAADAVNAGDLVTLYQRNPQSANASYTAKKIFIKGKIKEFQYNKEATPEDSTVAITFELPLGLPDIRMNPLPLGELIKRIEKTNRNGTWRNGGEHYELKYREGYLSIRSFWKNNYDDKSSGYEWKGSYKNYGDWGKLLSAGDEITISGLCNGKTMDVLISDATF